MLRMILSFTVSLALVSSPNAAHGQGPSQPARRTVALLDYVAGDYAQAVGPKGEVLSPSEFEEQVGFVKDAARELRADTGAKGEDLARRIDALATAVATPTPPDRVAADARAIREEVAQRFGVVLLPPRAPDLVHGKQLFDQSCAACHGVAGHPNGALTLSTKIPEFAAPAEVKTLSPRRAFSAITYGIQGTAMPAYDEAYDDASRWDLAFYLLTLSKEPASQDALALARAALVPTGYAELASLSDEELEQRLAAAGLDDAQRAKALAAVRRGPFAEVKTASAHEGYVKARHGVQTALRLARDGDREGARRALVASYLDDLEPHEGALRARDSGLVQELESGFVALRNAVEKPGPVGGEADEAAARLDALLARADAGGGSGGLVAFVGALAIALREGVEAALLVAAMLALLRKSNRSHDARAVHFGWMSALGMGALSWWVSGALIERLSGAHRELAEGVLQLVTAAILLYASHWVLAALSAKRLVSFLSERTREAAGASVIFGLTFVAVFREMFEVVLFFRTLLLDAPGSGPQVALGAVTGLVALAILVALFQKVGRKLKPRPLLLVCGVLLCGLAVVMVGNGVRSLQLLGTLPLTVWGTFKLPALGVFATREGLLAQAFVLAGLIISALWSARTQRVPRIPGQPVAS